MTRAGRPTIYKTGEILDVALRIARIEGYQTITRQALASACGCSEATISHHFGTMGQLRRAIMRHAIIGRCLEVIAQGLAVRDKHALAAPESLRREAAGALT